MYVGVSVLVASSLVLVEAGPLKVFVLAGQSNMEGQGLTNYSPCPRLYSVFPALFSSAHNSVSFVGHELQQCLTYHSQAEVSKINASSPDKRQDNGTLTYQLSDPRTAAEFAPCWLVVDMVA